MNRAIANTALVLEGGGFRGMYTSGVLDAFLEKQLYFPYVIGVSAGAAYGISYISRQFGRNKEVNLKYTADPRYMSLGNLIRKGNLFDWDFVYGEVPDSLVPFDYDAFFRATTEFVIGVTNVETGQPEYFTTRGMSREQLLATITASSSLPFVSKIARINGMSYLDGGLADSIPVQQALLSGYERAVVVLTRNHHYRKKPASFQGLIKTCYKRYPHLVEALLTRADSYNNTLAQLEIMEKEGRVFVIRPQQKMSVSRIENNPQKLDALYQIGYEETLHQFSWLHKWLEQ
jgi:predicted patatin/cPLA2 family phospholipase